MSTKQYMDPEDTVDPYGTIIDGNTLRPKDCIDVSKITNRIYLGSYDAGARMKTALKLLGITHILTVGNNMPPAFENSIEGFLYKVVELHDHHRVDISKFFPECLQFIESALQKNDTNKILIHCYAGVSRSSTVTIAFLMETFLMTYPEATEHVRKARHWIDPNPGFRNKLKVLAQQLGIHNEIDAKKYEEVGKILLNMHKEKTISEKNRNHVLNVFEDVFGEFHPHTISIRLETKPFVESHTI